MSTVDRYRGALIGLAVGDALGTTMEFCTPGSFKPLAGKDFREGALHIHRQGGTDVGRCRQLCADLLLRGGERQEDHRCPKYPACRGTRQAS